MFPGKAGTVDGYIHFSCLELVPEGSVALLLHILVLGEQRVKDSQSGLEVQVHHICKKKQH